MRGDSLHLFELHWTHTKWQNATFKTGLNTNTRRPVQGLNHGGLSYLSAVRMGGGVDIFTVKEYIV